MPDPVAIDRRHLLAGLALPMLGAPAILRGATPEAPVARRT